MLIVNRVWDEIERMSSLLVLSYCLVPFLIHSFVSINRLIQTRSTSHMNFSDGALCGMWCDYQLRYTSNRKYVEEDSLLHPYWLYRSPQRTEFTGNNSFTGCFELHWSLCIKWISCREMYDGITFHDILHRQRQIYIESLLLAVMTVETTSFKATAHINLL